MPEGSGNRSAVVQRALAVVAETHKAAVAYDRADLAGRVDRQRARLQDPSFHILVVGEFKQGKSSLVNALLNATICPVDDDIATAVPTSVRYGAEPEAAVIYEPPQVREGEDRPEPRRETIPVENLHEYVTEARVPTDGDTVRSVDIGLPRELLSDGLVIVDTPGVGGLGSPHTTRTIGALPMADAVLFCSDASQEFSGPEMEFLKIARSMCPNVAVVLTKTDLYPAWEKIKQLDEGHLTENGVQAPIIPVSSTLRQHAVSSDDRAVNEESGFPELVRYLTEEIVRNAEKLTVKTVGQELLQVLEQLEARFKAEKQALDKPEEATRRQADLESAKAAADRLKSQSSGWQQTLSDGIQDLNADVEHDLRARFRKINQQVDESLEQIDPAEAWDEFEPWLYRRVAEDVTNNYRFLQQRSSELSEQVGAHFDIERQEIAVQLDVSTPGESLRRAGADAAVEVEKMSTGQAAMTGVRGGYIGMLMFGVLGSMVGLALGPLPIGVGLLMGKKELKKEKGRQLNARRLQAKNAQRRYMDEAQFMAGKDVRDALRRIHRQLRDYFKERADELAKSTSASLAAAQEAAKAADPTKQKANVEAELTRISKLRDKVFVMAPGLRG